MHRERCEIVAAYITNTGATVRQAANKYGISKSTIHKDISERLKEVNRSLYEDTRIVLEKNMAERHLRGGEATKRKYELIKSLKNKNPR